MIGPTASLDFMRGSLLVNGAIRSQLLCAQRRLKTATPVPISKFDVRLSTRTRTPVPGALPLRRFEHGGARTSVRAPPSCSERDQLQPLVLPHPSHT